jgi:gamma-glutamyltranspeptidase/glutathione hydrolase
MAPKPAPLARSRRRRPRAAVAAGHPATVEAGAAVLDAGGTAADAAVAACLASCVAETVMTGLLGGGHAIYFDATAGRARNLDCFCTVPGLGAQPAKPAAPGQKTGAHSARLGGAGGPLLELDVPFGAELVHYSVGPASCAVPGVPAGLDALWREHGRLPWHELCEPALRLAREGVAMPPAHVACLEMLAPVMTMREGGRIYAPHGRLLRPGDPLRQPGLVAALELIAAEGARSVYTGSIADTLLQLIAERDGSVTRADLEGYRAVWSEPAEVEYAGTRFLSRAGLNAPGPALARLPALRGRPEPGRTLAFLDALDEASGAETHTTNLVTVDAGGSVCVLTTSLGLGSGDWLPGLDLHLNSMLGETDLLVGPLAPGARMQSMMAPSLAFHREGLALAIGAAGGTRLRTALVGVAAGILDEGLEPQAAVDRPRVVLAGGTVNAEPGADERALAELEARGLAVRRWPARHHYFGGVSAVSRAGVAGDPRRSGAAREL